mmetsp:Transcript_40709/g.105251  ORF Transcript_40709/g.105251 Transcript_40709/m.105251 type:complete len:237 (+) Transcript_40709:191-901(+)
MPTLAQQRINNRVPFCDARRVLLVTAHPDDETMFFAPTVQALKAAGAYVSLLCLSNGGAGGLGAQREKELNSAAKVLQIDDATVVDDPSLQDGHFGHWCPKHISAVVQDHCKHVCADTVLTFDAGGVSGHRNHCATYDGVRHFAGHCGGAGINFWKLDTVPLVRKYIGVVDMLLVLWQQCFQTSEKGITKLPTYCTSLRVPQVWAAMRCHSSQLVWFRWLYLMFSRYIFVNTWSCI